MKLRVNGEELGVRARMRKTILYVALIAILLALYFPVWAQQPGKIARIGLLDTSKPWAITREEMKNCVWLRPELVAQIEFTEWTVEDQLRHSKFVALAENKNPQQVTRNS